jgi:hypothetical protein
MGRRGYPPEFRRKVLDLVEPASRSLTSPRRLGLTGSSRASLPLVPCATASPGSPEANPGGTPRLLPDRRGHPGERRWAEPLP